MEANYNRYFLEPLKVLRGILFCALISLALFGCAVKQKKPREVFFVPSSFAKLSGWDSDNHLLALETFRKSCSAIMKRNASKPISSLTQIGGKVSDWQSVCSFSQNVKTPLDAKKFFETKFKVYEVRNGSGSALGRMTGYYEIELNGSKEKTEKYRHPIYGVPTNLMNLKGQRGFCHGSINRGVLREQRLELAWTDSQPRLFFAHMQGSGVVKLDNGEEIKIGYAAQNGFAYTSIANAFTKYGIDHLHSTKQTIEWLENNPDLGAKIMEQNKSYVFFRTTKGESPIGSQGVALTKERSIAIDSGLYPYGSLFWLETRLPQTSYSDSRKPYQRLMVAQDSGGAIKGAVRADIFFGRGHRAEALASGTSSPGKLYILVPKSIKLPKRYRAY